MALVQSSGPVLGSPAVDFRLPATDGNTYSLADFDAETLVVLFICNHCPYVVAVVERLVALAKGHADHANFVAISSNDAVRYPDDSFENMGKFASSNGFGFPYLYDETQEVARAYDAQCTPDIYVFDSARKLAYRGRLDDNWRDANAVTTHDLDQALTALRQGAQPSADQKPSMGCSIKWKF